MNETDFKKEMKVHSSVLIGSFEKYYPKKPKKAKEDRIRDPFLARTNIEPDFKKLCSSIQSQPSH
jgi:hypothetical protein